MFKITSYNILLILLCTLLISSCEKEPILTINNKVEAIPIQKERAVNKKKRKIHSFKIFRKKKDNKKSINLIRRSYLGGLSN
jgi:hypothetical protein